MGLLSNLHYFVDSIKIKLSINILINSMKKQGFTLIELLVVIAIIGILSSIVLVSLNDARDKGKDASIRGSLSSLRAEAELIFDDDGDYDAVCGDAVGPPIVVQDQTFITALLEADSLNGSLATSDCSSDAATGDGEWAIGVLLNGGGAYCVDSSGWANTKNKAGFDYTAVIGTPDVPATPVYFTFPTGTGEVCN